MVLYIISKNSVLGKTKELVKLKRLYTVCRGFIKDSLNNRMYG